MKVGQLRKLLEGVDDDAELLVSAGDHSYARASAHHVDVGYSKRERREHFTEWHEGVGLEDDWRSIKALVVA